MITPSVIGSTGRGTDLAVCSPFFRCLPGNDDNMKSRGKIPRTKLTGLTADLAFTGRWQVCEVTFRCRADTAVVLVARGAQSRLVYLLSLPRSPTRGPSRAAVGYSSIYPDTRDSISVICGKLNGIDSSPDRREQWALRRHYVNSTLSSMFAHVSSYNF